MNTEEANSKPSAANDAMFSEIICVGVYTLMSHAFQLIVSCSTTLQQVWAGWLESQKTELNRTLSRLLNSTIRTLKFALIS